ncbi:hypothetical protein GGR51DRAFT_506119 [Nemania sp. FL0031]|nr:hypothetical protein GGR51DRAFT_506119 [Nemania sp. FL0031]
MASTPSIYQPLDPALKHVRVLELLPGVFESDLRAILRTVALAPQLAIHSASESPSAPLCYQTSIRLC